MQAQDVLLRRAGWGAVQSCRAMRLDDPRAFIATAPQRLTLHMTEARAAMSSEERL